MTVDDFSFTSDNNTDKIVYESEDLTNAVSNGATETISHTNPYGSKCFVTLSWSIDSTNFYPAQAILAASNPYIANAWVDNSTVYVYFENYSGGNATFYYKYVLDTIE